MPGSEMVVSRAAYSDNTSKYFADGKKSSRTDVEELLASKGIDLENNRFLILQVRHRRRSTARRSPSKHARVQGEVEQIATMKPKGQTEHDTGFLEYLEDVIGSNRYAEKIAEKGTEVEQLNDDRALKLNRVKAVESDREQLEVRALGIGGEIQWAYAGFAALRRAPRRRRRTTWRRSSSSATSRRFRTCSTAKTLLQPGRPWRHRRRRKQASFSRSVRS